MFRINVCLDLQSWKVSKQKRVLIIEIQEKILDIKFSHLLPEDMTLHKDCVLYSESEMCGQTLGRGWTLPTKQETSSYILHVCLQTLALQVTASQILWLLQLIFSTSVPLSSLVGQQKPAVGICLNLKTPSPAVERCCSCVVRMCTGTLYKKGCYSI